MATPADNTPGRGGGGPENTTGLGKTVAFRTIGCKLNQCETAQMQETLLAEGYRLVGWDSTADIRVVNTCTVTAKSDRTCRHEIRLAKRLDPDSTVVVTGCYAQIDPNAIAAIPGVNLVLGNLDKLRLAEHLAEVTGGAAICTAEAEPGARPATGAAALASGATEQHPALSVSPYPDIRSSRASSSATSTATPGPSSRSRPAATPAAPTASSPSPGDRREACPWPTSFARWTCWRRGAFARWC